MEELSSEFERQADELRGLALLDDKEKITQSLLLFVEDTDREEFVGVCYSIGLAIYTYIEMTPDAGFVEFEINGNAETSLPMAFYLNTFLNSLIWQNPGLAMATANSIFNHAKNTRAFFLWKLILICQSLSNMLEADIQGDVER